MSSEIANDYVGTCVLMMQYYRALKMAIVRQNLHKSSSKLESFIKRLKKKAPLIRTNGRLSRNDKKNVETVMKQIHNYVVSDLIKWQKGKKNKNIIQHIRKQIDSHHDMIKKITSVNASDMYNISKSTEVHENEYTSIPHRYPLRSERCRNHSDDEDSDEDSDEDFKSDDEFDESGSDSGSEFDESGSDSDDYDTDSEDESEEEMRSRKKQRINKKGDKTGDKSPKSDILKMKKFIHKRQQESNSSVRKQIDTFSKMSREQRKTILNQMKQCANDASVPLMYRIMLSKLPQNAKTDITNRLESLDKNDDECPKYREYVNATLKIPFETYVQSKVNSKSKPTDITKFLKHTEKCMDDAVHGHSQAKKQILQFVAQNITNSSPKGLILGIEGPMGNGKTTLIEKGFAKAIGRPFVTIPLGGVQDGSFLEGHGYTYEGSRWGQIVNTLMTAKCMNPIIYMDELDKVSRTAKGDEINNLLIHLIDPSQNHHFRDKYFTDMDIDLSQCIFIFSYNDRDLINPVLMDRITNLKTRGFRLPEKVVICRNFLLTSIMDDVGIRRSNIKFSEDVLRWIVQNYTYEGGVRNLKKICYEIIREINLRHLTTKTIKYPYVVKREILEKDILSKKTPVQYDKIHDKPSVGKINGLYATCNDTGGLVVVEAVWLPSDSNLNLKLTGNQGNVMQESMHVAKTLSWNLLPEDKREELKAQWEKSGKQGIHVHCPEGGVPKDGPSAGAAITTAIYSLMSGRKIRNDIAITGEIDLSGKIMAIGGLESKIFGAKTAGCKTVLCPEDNWNSLQQVIEDHPDILNDNFQVKMVSHIDDVFAQMLENE